MLPRVVSPVQKGNRADEQQRDDDANYNELKQDMLTLCFAEPPRLLR